MKRTMFALAILILVVALGLTARSLAPVQAEPTVIDLEWISEATGYLATLEPFSDDCFLDEGYQVYLCEAPREPVALAADPEARAQAVALAQAGQALLIPDSAAMVIMVFDATTGDLIDPSFIILDDDATGTVIHAISGPDGQILVSDQTRNVVHQYAANGSYLGVFAPAGGANSAIMQNIRGMALRPNGNLLVTVGAGFNADAIAEFDTDGNFLGNFVLNALGGLASPFDVYRRVDTDWLVSSINSNQILRYALETGAFIDELASIISFPQQILEAANGNVLVANFSGTQTGIVELSSTGALVGVYDPPGVSSYRGIYELPNGNLLVSTTGGVHEITRNGALVETKYEGSTRFIEPVTLPPLLLRKTVGLDPAMCATTDEIAVGPYTAVTYCFEVRNTGEVTLGLHDLVDSQIGVLFEGLPVSLMPNASVFITHTALITETTVNTATWTAYNPGPTDLVEATDSATVTVVPPSIALTKTVGLDPTVCATTDAITVGPNTAVTYCFEVTNTSLTTFGLHDLVDSQIGVLFKELPVSLMPNASVFVTHTALITETTVNTATWTAYNAGPINLVDDTDTATVTVAFRTWLPLIRRP